MRSASRAPLGCFARRQNIVFAITRGVASGPGLFVAGVQPAAIPFFAGQLLVNPILVFGHSLNANGEQSLPIAIPDDTNLLNTDFYAQVLYVDLGAPQLVSFSTGMTMRVR